MTGHSWVFDGEGVGGGFAATNPLPMSTFVPVIPNETKWSEGSQIANVLSLLIYRKERGFN
jgi:hypothetical protein